MRFFGLFLLGTTLAACGTDEADPIPNAPQNPTHQDDPIPGQIWVANRADGSVSVIDSETASVVTTVKLPDNGEPMYVNYSAAREIVFVGDRANDRVLVFDAETAQYQGPVATGAGVFHQWTNPNSEQLWVNNDIDKTTTVIDVDNLTVLTTIPMPADLAAMPGAGAGLPKPHDVLIAPEEDAAYVSYLGFDGASDYVVRFDTTTFQETHRAAVGKDPHLSATDTNNALYVPAQNSDAVYVLERDDLSEIDVLFVPGAHGAGMAHDGGHFYVTNLPAGGDMALYVIDTETNTVVNNIGINAPMNGVPHNVALSGDDTRVFVTHSGPDTDIVSVFDLDSPIPAGVSDMVDVGKNPFGLGYVPVESMAVSERTRVRFDVSELSTLRDGHHYEGWAIFDGQPVSTGKFNVDASGVATDLDGIAIPDGLFDAGRDLRPADALVITIEEPGDIDIVPNDTHYLAGDIQSGAFSTLTVAHADAIGSDFADAAGKYILATPTDGPDSYETSGVWFLSLQMASPTPGLTLPTLPAGWKYEGWAVHDGTPLTTGKFTAVDMADEAAPYSDTEFDAPPFPGEDFLIGAGFPINLSNAAIVVSIEPVPDDSPDPFLLKPLLGHAPDNAADHQTFTMDNQASGLPLVSAILSE